MFTAAAQSRRNVPPIRWKNGDNNKNLNGTSPHHPSPISTTHNTRYTIPFAIRSWEWFTVVCLLSLQAEKKYAGPERFLSHGLANVLDIFTVYNYPSHEKRPTALARSIPDFYHLSGATLSCPPFENGRIFISLSVAACKMGGMVKGISSVIVVLERSCYSKGWLIDYSSVASTSHSWRLPFECHTISWLPWD